MTRAFLLHHLLGVFVAVAAAQEARSPGDFVALGERAFFDGRIDESVAAFDRAIELAPAIKPQLWQRGLALYYQGKYREGRQQFESHQTVNPNDVENAAWHFICVARLEGVEAARKALIPIEGDARVPMKEVHDLFAGKGTPPDVLKAASSGTDDSRRNQLCYAHLYLGLYFEATGDEQQAKHHILLAATEYRMDHYMGKCAQVHARLRHWVPKVEG
jgi:lipoprotein NlpI